MLKTKVTDKPRVLLFKKVDIHKPKLIRLITHLNINTFYMAVNSETTYIAMYN